MRFRRAGIDRKDAGMRMRRTQNLGVQQAGQRDVVGVNRSAGDLTDAVHLAHALAYNGKLPLDQLVQLIGRDRFVLLFIS
jgi:hypothetical protein